MDLMGHDVLNNNQAVLGYLELILASEGVDKKVRKYAEKAVSHIRTSTILVDNVKRLLVTRDTDFEKLKPVNLTGTLGRAEQEIIRMFPDKKIKLKLPVNLPAIRIIGNSAAEYLVLNILVSMVRLDPKDIVSLQLKVAEGTIADKMYWRVTVEDPTAILPEIAKNRALEEAYGEDRSIAVKMVGMLYCSMMATMLGGDFEARVLDSKSEPGGAVFVTSLVKAGEP